MPVRDVEASAKREVAYVPGYDWLPGKFGPSPGIAKAHKEEFGEHCLSKLMYCLYFNLLLASGLLFVILSRPVIV